MTTQNKMNAALLQEAATWMMRLADEKSGEEDWEAWRQWSAQSEQHLQLRQMMETLSDKLQHVPPAVGKAVLDAPRAASRRTALKALTLVLTAAPAGWLAMQLPWQEWNADYRNGIGTQRKITLPDGTLLRLDSGSAVNVVFGAKSRVVELIAGRVFIATAADPAADSVTTPRPFLVRTRQGQVRAIGTRFDVRQNLQDSNVTVVQGAVEITPADAGTRPLILQARQKTRFTRAAVSPPGAAESADTLWLSGRIQINDVRLEDLIRELSRYRPGVLRCDPRVAGMRVSGSYQLDDTDLALSLLVSAFPLQVSRPIPYWTEIVPR